MFSYINGTMPAWLKTAARIPVLAFADSCLRGIGQVVFMNNPFTGLMILTGIYFFSGWLGFAGTFGVAVSVLAAIILGLNRETIRAGLYGFNGVLVGLALATFSKNMWDGRVIIFILILSAISTILTEALNKIFDVWKIPSFTLPFNFVALLFLAASFYFFESTIISVAAPPLPAITDVVDNIYYLDIIFIFNAVFRGIGQLFFVNNPLSGIIIFAGILAASRIAGTFALVGSGVGMLAGVALGANSYTIYNGLWGFNTFVAAIAIGGFFYVLTWRSALLAIGCAIVVALLFGAISAFLVPWGVPALTLPFCLGTLAFVLIGKTSLVFTPVEGTMTTPEQHLQFFYAKNQ